VVTLLGIVFCFILAVDRGWVGPLARIGIGGVAALAVLTAGLELRRRFGATHSAVAAVGAGIAGGYATLLASTALYHLLPDAAALVLAAAIAATGVAISLRWSSELVAGIGLIGALLAPVAIASQGGISTLGTAFAAVVLSGASAVALRARWQKLLAVAALLAAPQILALVATTHAHDRPPAMVAGLVAVYVGIYLASAISGELLRREGTLGRLTTSLAFGSAAIAGIGSYALFHGPEAQAAALSVLVLVYGGLSAIFFFRPAGKELSALLAAVAFMACALALAAALSGSPLAYAWAAESSALAWLARRSREIRFQLWSAIYALLALGHLLTSDAVPRGLVDPGLRFGAGGAPAAVVVAAAFAVFARHAGPWPFDRGSRLSALLAGAQRSFRSVGAWGGALLLTYAASVLAIATAGSFDTGRLAGVAIWSLAGLGVVLGGAVRRHPELRFGGVIWLSGVTAFVLAAGADIESDAHAWSFAIVASALLAGSVAHELRRVGDAANLVSAIWAVAAAILGLVASALALDGRVHGLVLLGMAGLYWSIAARLARCERQRSFVTVLWSTGAALGAASAPGLVHGVLLATVLALAAVTFAWLAFRSGELRLAGGAAWYAVLTVLVALDVDAPPSHLFALDAARSGSAGALAAALAVGAVAFAGSQGSERVRRVTARAWWLGGVLAVYGVSIAILDLVAHALPGSRPEDAFRSGHTAVSAFWGLLALGLLYAGLTRWRSLRVAGLALFAVSLGKLFLFDLGSLSSITRALSFLAVGAVLLVGGFFYQRLASNHAGEVR
jgi:hypothetical protein